MMDVRILSTLAETIERSRELLASRESTTQVLVLPLLRGLGYAVSNPLELRCGEPLGFADGGSATADIAIYEGDGKTLRMVVDVRALGADLWSRSPLAKAVGAAGLRFLVVTDGARYQIYGDLQRPGSIDDAPFCAFSLAGPDADYAHASATLSRFARDAFDPGALISKAEDEALTAALRQRLMRALRAPAAEPDFLRWLSEGIYEGKRTRPVLERLGRLAEEAVTPAILGLLSEDYIDALRERMQVANEIVARGALARPQAPRGAEPVVIAMIRKMAERAGSNPAEIVHRETTNYHGVGLKTPSRWFVRWFDGSRRRALTTLVPVEEARALVRGFVVEEAPQSFGVSRVQIDDAAQIWALEALVVRSLDICRRGDQLPLAAAAE